MGFMEWIRYRNTEDYIETVENWTDEDTQELEENGIEYNPENQARAYQQAQRERQAMKSFGWDDIHKRF